MPAADTRIVYGARCTWWDSIDKIAQTRAGPSGVRIPCCPYCASPLFEVDSEKEWTALVADTEPHRWPGYAAFMAWLRGKCIEGGMMAAKAQWEKETGRA